MNAKLKLSEITPPQLVENGATVVLVLKLSVAPKEARRTKASQSPSALRQSGSNWQLFGLPTPLSVASDSE